MKNRWIGFDSLPNLPGRKTARWKVRSITGIDLGVIRWWSHWRQYAFFPDGEKLFEQQCLRDIADFCEERTKQHRKLKSLPALTTAEKIGA